MGDDTNTFPAQGRSEGGGRGNRSGPGNRDNGGFRIRLSDNEMQAARALQEAFQLRSTVAVLGFSLRTLAQQLEAGQLDELVAQLRAQGGGRAATPRSERGGERRGGERERPAASRGPRVDPFARPSKPVPAAPVPEASELTDDGDDSAAPVSEAESELLDAETEASSEVSSAESAEAVEQAS